MLSLLHVRGGVSPRKHRKRLFRSSSPRPWRCFLHGPRVHRRQHVFSTSVEVFPHIQGLHVADEGLLHVRGGVSAHAHDSRTRTQSSPRSWRCFRGAFEETASWHVFSTSVEVFPTRSTTTMMQLSLLHVRGGVSERDARGGTRYTSSPRPWRCFHHGLVHFGTEQVFSTSVEVFPPYAHAVSHTCRLLHVRGGVAISRRRPSSRSLSSPRPWRCFLHVDDLQKPKWVFSTSVEVFRMNCFTASFVGSLLHVRGGVSLFKRPPVKAIESSPRPWRCFRRHAN